MKTALVGFAIQDVQVKERHFPVEENETKEEFIKKLHLYMIKKGLHQMKFIILKWPNND